jgi:hypothetical protein
MIGRPITGSSFLGCISYNLEDKRELTEEQKEQLSQLEGVRHKNRAEVLVYNKCFGDKYELAAQFREVAQLSKRVEKPVFHFPIRLGSGRFHKPRRTHRNSRSVCKRNLEVGK